MNISRRQFFGGLGLVAGAAALPGCANMGACAGKAKVKAKTALQLYSIRTYIGGVTDKKTKKLLKPGVGLEKALADVAEIGYKGIEFAGYYNFTAPQIKKMLDDNGLVGCGTHVGNNAFGFDTKAWKFNPDVLKETCEFNLGYGNRNIICPGGGNMPPGGSWRGESKATPQIDDFIKRLCDLYNQAAEEAAKYGCRIGLHNHMWEFLLKMTDGTSYWDYFFSHTKDSVCMEQDVGWTVCAGADPCEQYAKYPHRSPTLHAKENGMGKDVKKFDAILGRPGRPGAIPVDWDALIPASEADGVEWYVVECERHEDTLDAVSPSYSFLQAKGLN